MFCLLKRQFKSPLPLYIEVETQILCPLPLVAGALQIQGDR